MHQMDLEKDLDMEAKLNLWHFQHITNKDH